VLSKSPPKALSSVPSYGPLPIKEHENVSPIPCGRHCAGDKLPALQVIFVPITFREEMHVLYNGAKKHNRDALS